MEKKCKTKKKQKGYKDRDIKSKRKKERKKEENLKAETQMNNKNYKKKGEIIKKILIFEIIVAKCTIFLLPK